MHCAQAFADIPSLGSVPTINGPTIMLSSGRYFSFADPAGCDFDHLDVAHSLSNICRFTGRCSSFYSAAQHGLLLSEMVPTKYALVALLSQAPCAFVGDIAKPLKLRLPEYGEIERRVKHAVRSRLGLPLELPESVRKAKDALLEIELREITIDNGRDFDFDVPRNNVYSIYDIATGLSNSCRFTGHCREYYSVAQHSVLVSYAVAPEDAMAGLMHDAPEAFVGDVAKPLKVLLSDYAEIEARVEADVFRRFGLPAKLSPGVKHADVVLLRTEQRDLMGAGTHDWQFSRGVAPLSDMIKPLPPAEARALFLRRYQDLSGSLPAEKAYEPVAPRTFSPLLPDEAKAAFLLRLHQLI